MNSRHSGYEPDALPLSYPAVNGVLDKSWTRNLLIRSQTLCPIELQARLEVPVRFELTIVELQSTALNHLATAPNAMLINTKHLVILTLIFSIINFSKHQYFILINLIYLREWYCIPRHKHLKKHKCKYYILFDLGID